MEKNKNTRTERMVTVATVRTATEARRIKSELESAGLHCELCAEAASASQWVKARAGEIKIQVGGSQARRAIKILQALGKGGTVSYAKAFGGRAHLRIAFPRGPWVETVIGALALIAAASLLSLLFF